MFILAEDVSGIGHRIVDERLLFKTRTEANEYVQEHLVQFPLILSAPESRHVRHFTEPTD